LTGQVRVRVREEKYQGGFSLITYGEWWQERQGKVEGKVKAKAAESNTLIPYLGEMTA
jgi:hypothetical protein